VIGSNMWIYNGYIP